MWLSKRNLSELAFRYCLNIKDDPKVWKKITIAIWAYLYCRDVKDRPEVRKYITENNNDKTALLFLTNVESALKNLNENYELIRSGNNDIYDISYNLRYGKDG